MKRSLLFFVVVMVSVCAGAVDNGACSASLQHSGKQTAALTRCHLMGRLPLFADGFESGDLSAWFGAWKPPIGIPAPSFGINETHLMYAGRNYDFGAGPVPYPDAGFGPYTHYIDNTNPAATDIGNPYGTPALPRKTIPELVPAGSVVEIHGGPYGTAEYSHYQINRYFQGTAANPVFVRGFNATAKPVFHRSDRTIELRLGGTYFIIENLELVDVAVLFPRSFQHHNHIALRHLEVHGYTRRNGNVISTGSYRYGETGADDASHIVIYDNYIHHNGKILTDRDPLVAAIHILSESNNIWVVDNHLHHNGADSFHAGHAGYDIHDVFVGRNIMHHDGENAIDIKTANDFVISQNLIYGYRPGAGAPNGAALRVNDEEWDGQSNIWLLFNEVFDAEICIDVNHAIFPPYMLGNLIYDCPVGISWNGADTVAHNTVYDTGRGIGTAANIYSNVVANASDYHISGVGNVHDNLLWQKNGPVVIHKGECINCVENDPLFANSHGFCRRLGWYEYHVTNAVLIQNSGTQIQVQGANFTAMGVEEDDRIHVTLIPEIAYDGATNSDGCQYGGSSRPQCDWLRVDSAAGDTITLKRDILQPGETNVTGVEIRLWHYPYSTHGDELLMDAGSGFEVGDVIEYDYDGVARTIVGITPSYESDGVGHVKDRVEFAPISIGPIRPTASVCNWASNTDLCRDFSLCVGSPGIDFGVEGGLYDLFFNTFGINIKKDAVGHSRPAVGGDWDAGALEHRP